MSQVFMQLGQLRLGGSVHRRTMKEEIQVNI